MPTSPTPLPTIPPFPALADKATGTYNSKAYDWATGWADDIAPAIEALADNAYDNAVEAAASANAAATSAALTAQATGTAIGYTFSTTTTDSDPGAGVLRLNNATQNASTGIRTSNTSVAGSDVTALVATFATGTSTVKGRLRLQHAADLTKWLLFDVTAVASPSGYKNITATCTASSAASPFANGDALALSFQATGDKGDTGATGAAGTFGGTATSTAEFLSGSDIASAATVNLNAATGNRVHITGTTAITAVTLTRGPRTVIFDGVLTLTHHATNNNLPGGADITTAAGDRAVYESDGTTVYCVSYVRANGQPVVLDLPYLHVRDEKSAGTEGGGSSSGANERVLNTVVSNSITGASLASNRVTLPAGTYRVEARAPASCNATAVGTRHKLILYNVTDTANVIVGSASGVDNSANLSANIVNVTESVVRGTFTLGSSKVLSLSHYYSAGLSTCGLGKATGSSGVEVYAEVQFWKVG